MFDAMKWRSIFLLTLLLATVIPAAVSASGWREGSPMSTGRAFAGGAVLGSDLYVVGGDSTSGPRAVAEIYDIRGDIWRAAPALPVGLQQFGMAEQTLYRFLVEFGVGRDELLRVRGDSVCVG